MEVFTNQSSLYLFRHSIPQTYFSPPSFQFFLPSNVLTLLPLPLGGYASFHQPTLDTSAITLLNPLILTSSDLDCEIYPKPNLYLVQMNAYISDCADVLLSKQIIMNNTNASNTDYCIV